MHRIQYQKLIDRHLDRLDRFEQIRIQLLQRQSDAALSMLLSELEKRQAHERFGRRLHRNEARTARRRVSLHNLRKAHWTDAF